MTIKGTKRQAIKGMSSPPLKGILVHRMISIGFRKSNKTYLLMFSINLERSKAMRSILNLTRN